MFQGYLRLGSVELANAARTEAYVRNILPGFPLRGCQGCDELARALGESYNSPLLDRAPWIDPTNTSTYDFYGFYPVSIEGLDDSTVSATVTESLGAGGYINSPRAGTREVRVRGVLVAGTDLGLRAGMVWLNEALTANPCEDGNCAGRQMSFYAGCPQFEACYGYEEFGDSGVTTGLRPSNVYSPAPWTVNQDIQATGHFQPILGWDGLTISWGWSEFRGDINDRLTGLVRQFGPVTPYRTNKVANPEFAINTALWGTDATLTRVATGGPDGGTFGRLSFTTSGTMQTSIVTALSTQNMLQFQARTDLPTFTVTIRSSIDNSVIQTQSFTGSTSWAQYSLIVPNARDGLLEFTGADSGAHELDVSHVIVEAATQLLPYFNGSRLPMMQPTNVPDDPGYSVSWLGPEHASESRMEWLGNENLIRYEFCGDNLFGWLYVESGYGNISVSLGFATRYPDAYQARAFERYVNNVARTSGPIVTRELKTSIGVGQVVEFTVVAGTPFVYAAGNTLDWTLENPVTFEDEDPPETPPVVVIDPDCPVVPDPPRPPIIENACVLTPGTWDRYIVSIPAFNIPKYSVTVPTFDVTVPQEMRQIRVRTYPNPLGVQASRTNLAPRPYPTGTGGWTSPNAGVFPVTYTTGVARRLGTASVLGTNTGTDSRVAVVTRVGAKGNATADLAPVNASSFYTFSVYFMTQNAASARYSIAVTWLTNAGSVVGTNIQSPQATDSVTLMGAAPGGWVRAEYYLQAPVTAERAQMDLTIYTASGGLADPLQRIFTQDAQIERGPEASPYFDGNVADSDGLAYSWAGATLGSLSLAVIDQFANESEFIVSYAPADARVVVNSQTRQSFIYLPSDPSRAINASNLLYGPEGGPMVWPELSCGISHFVTIDVPPGTGDGSHFLMELTRRE